MGDFQEQVLNEIMQAETAPRRAALAGLAAIVQCTGCVRKDPEGRLCLVLRTGRRQALTKCFTLLEKNINISTVSVSSEGTSDSRPGHSSSGHLSSARTEVTWTGEAAQRICSALLLPCAEGLSFQQQAVSDRLLTDRRCVRAFLAQQFLCIGTVRDPGKEYYLSYEILSGEQARQTQSLLEEQGLPLHIAEHGRTRAIVTRDSDVIVDVLNLLGAHVSMMDMENTRIVRQVRGGVNRKVNCETANIMKTVAASRRQLEEIRLIRESSVWETLPDSLKQTALLREQYPESSLQELGGMLDPPVGKSGVNHRLRRLSAIAQELQDSRGS